MVSKKIETVESLRKKVEEYQRKADLVRTQVEKINVKIAELKKQRHKLWNEDFYQASEKAAGIRGHISTMERIGAVKMGTRIDSSGWSVCVFYREDGKEVKIPSSVVGD